MDRTYDTGGALDGLGLRHENSNVKPKNALDIHKAHDLCIAFLLGEIPGLGDSMERPLHTAVDVLCWVLNHEHAGNKGEGFQKNLNGLEELARFHGFMPVLAPTIPTPREGEETFENKFFVSSRGSGLGTRILFLQPVPREISRAGALNLAAWLVSIAEENEGDFERVLQGVQQT